MDLVKILKNILKIFIIIVFLCFTMFLAILNLTTGTTIFAIFTMFFILFFYGNKFEIVELLGAKFKLKELNNSINELKDLSLVFAEIGLTLIQEKNRWSSNNTAKEVDFFEKINKILNNVNVSPEIKEKIFYDSWHKYILLDYEYNMRVQVHKEIEESNLQPNDKNYLKNNCFVGKNKLISAYKEAQKKGVVFTIETIISMEDFIYYNENHKHKDIDRWIEINNKWSE